MAHGDQFTAVGPPLAGSGMPFSGFSTKATGMEYGLNVQGDRCGVYGESVRSESGRFSDNIGVGVHGFGENLGVVGNGNRGLAGVYGYNNRGRIGTIGAVMGGGTGVVGASLQGLGNPLQTWQTVPTASTGGSGTGVLGVSGTGPGVSGTSAGGPGVSGTSAGGPGVRGFSSGSELFLPPGVEGVSDRGAGVTGRSSSYIGVLGLCGGGGVAVSGSGTGDGTVGVVGSGPGGAGIFIGKVLVRGNFTVMEGTKNFQIDHPLDPENKYLLHSCVESSDRKNVYDGVVLLDGDGAAWVDLPEWFEALNGDYCYQLTAVGGAAPDLHVAEEISENRFRIAGGQEGLKVCWQVTGSRKDPWAAANPFDVEEEKPQKDRGRYLQPELYDAPAERRIEIVPVQLRP